jgi:small subunit ribosomal protein S17
MAKKKNEEEAEQTPVADDAGAEEPPTEAQSEAKVEADAVADEPVAEAPEEEPAAEEEPAEETAADAEPEAEPKPAPAAKATPKKAAKPKPKQAAKPKAKKSARAEGTERKPIVRLPTPERVRGARKERRGIVVSSAMDKTIVVRVETVKPHPRYKKVVRHSTKFHAHDEGNVAKPGDVVRIVATRPLSKTKSWRLVEVVAAAK